MHNKKKHYNYNLHEKASDLLHQHYLLTKAPKGELRQAKPFSAPVAPSGKSLLPDAPNPAVAPHVTLDVDFQLVCFHSGRSRKEKEG